jgi:propionyl-CoA carboxylase alpha chain
VQFADEAICIGPGPSKDSYLRGDRIIAAAKASGANAIHPGYGFLSESAKFADDVARSGLVFVGPTSAAMSAMGDKINSKRIAAEAGCFVIPGFQGEVQDGAVAVNAARSIGYPVMIKASAGGGGKGMRVAYNDAQLAESFKLCKDEAVSSFGDGRLLLEKFIEEPHHIEIQVLADAIGNVIAFPEREVRHRLHDYEGTVNYCVV